MVDTMEIEAEVRDQKGTNRVRKLREEEIIPAVMYGSDGESTSIQLERATLLEALRSEDHVFEVQLSEDTHSVIVKDVQWDVLGEEILHVDFKRVTEDEEVEVEVPLETFGTSTTLEGSGAYMEKHMLYLPIQSTPDSIPQKIEVNINGIGIGDTIHVWDLDLPKGVSSAIPDDRLLFSVHEAVELDDDEEEELEIAPTAVEPELVGAEEDEEGAAEGEEEEEAAEEEE